MDLFNFQDFYAHFYANFRMHTQVFTDYTHVFDREQISWEF